MTENSLKAKFKSDALKEGWFSISLADKSNRGMPDLVMGSKYRYGFIVLECKLSELGERYPPYLFTKSAVQFEIMKKFAGVGPAGYLIFVVSDGKHIGSDIVSPLAVGTRFITPRPKDNFSILKDLENMLPAI